MPYEAGSSEGVTVDFTLDNVLAYTMDLTSQGDEITL